MAKPKTCIVIVGPTAVGKTLAAIRIASYLNTEIISADSRQCYREMNIGVAKPSPEELQQVRHHFINSHSITETVTAASYETYALQAAGQIFAQKDQVVVVGGTGLYIKAFCEGLDAIPAIPPEIRKQVQELSLHQLQQQIQQLDPAYYASGELQNPQRLMRALEVVLATGKSIRTYQQGAKQVRPFKIIKIGLELPRPQLYDRINKRVDQMIAHGLVDEVKALLPYRSLNALQTVGYTELFDYLDGRYSLDQAIDKIRQHSRHYAKRQLTWFYRDSGVEWFNPIEEKESLDYVVKQLQGY